MKKNILLILLNAFLYSQYYHTYRTAESLSMGETRLSVYHNTRSFLDNPALLVGQRSDFTILSTQIKIDSKSFDYLDFVNNHEDDFDNLSAEKESSEYKQALDNIQNDIRPFENSTIRNQLSLGIGMVKNDIGFHLQHVSTLHIRPDILLTPKFVISNTNEVMLAIGYGRKVEEISKKLKLGVNFKYFTKNTFDNLLFDMVRLSSATAVDYILDTIPAMTTGYSVEIGGLYQFTDDIIFSAVIRNFPGSYLDEHPGLFFDFGARWQYYGVEAVAEYSDFFNIFERPFAQHLHMGFRYTIPYVQVIDVRYGYNQGFPTIGVGLNLAFFHFNYAFHQKAYSDFLFDDVGKSHTIEIRFSF